jgi:hypothetical protein
MLSLFKCKCGKPPFSHKDYDSVMLGEDSHGAEVQIDTCKQCGKKWLRYLIEEPHRSKSGRWWRVPVANGSEEVLAVGDAKKYIEAQSWCYVGGCFYDGGIHKRTAPLAVL